MVGGSIAEERLPQRIVLENARLRANVEGIS